jgi:hypothetical protein
MAHTWPKRRPVTGEAQASRRIELGKEGTYAALRAAAHAIGQAVLGLTSKVEIAEGPPSANG